MKIQCIQCMSPKNSKNDQRLDKEHVCTATYTLANKSLMNMENPTKQVLLGNTEDLHHYK